MRSFLTVQMGGTMQRSTIVPLWPAVAETSGEVVERCEMTGDDRHGCNSREGSIYEIILASEIGSFTTASTPNQVKQRRLLPRIMGPIGEDEEGEKRLLPGDGPRKVLIRGNTKLICEGTGNCLQQLRARSANAGVLTP